MAISNFAQFFKNVTLTKDDGLLKIFRQTEFTSFCCGQNYDIAFSDRNTLLCRAHRSSVLWRVAGGKTKHNLGSAVVVVFWKW
jgi:hypothetical protein